MDSSIGAILVGFLTALVAYIGKRKIDSDNETKRLDIESKEKIAKAETEKNAENARIKIEADAALVKTEIEAAAAKLKLETEAAALLALAEVDRKREEQRAQDELALETFRAKEAKELEEYRTKRAETEMAATALQVEVVKEIAALRMGQAKTTKAVGGAEKSIGLKIDAAQQRTSEHITLSSDKVLGGVEKLRELFMLAFDLFLENPPALPDRVDRMMLAFKAGDVVEAQAVADEAPPQVSEEAA